MGLVKDQKVKVKLAPMNIEKLRTLGYVIPTKKATPSTKKRFGKEDVVAFGEEIEINVEDLNTASRVLVDITCDICGEPFQRTYQSYNMSMDKFGQIYCPSCSLKHRRATMQERYGVTSPFCLPGVREKINKTYQKKYGANSPMKNPIIVEKRRINNRIKYGVDHVMQLPENQEKYRNTCMERYGVPYCSMDPEIQAKMHKAFVDKYGVDNPFQVPEIRQKAMKTCMERFGVPYVTLSEEVREKMSQSLNGSEKVGTSIQQKYLHALYGGMLNETIKYYVCDIVLLDEDIVIEYNGSGHDASVTCYKSISQEDFDKKETKRSQIIRDEGFNLMIITSRKDYLPKDDILIDILNYAKNLFSTGHTWVNFDIDCSKIFYHKNPDGLDFDYGKLRKIKKEEVNVIGSNN